MSNDQNVEKNAKRRGKKKKNGKKSKSKKPFGGANEDVVFVEFNLESNQDKLDWLLWVARTVNKEEGALSR